jgi:hypothetical protein
MWTPITPENLQGQIANGEKVMDVALWPMWQAIRIDPVKWQLHPWGDEGSGFWVVAIFGRHVLWFNDIEWGFNISRYSVAGTIGEYCCNQDELQHSMVQIKRMMTTGEFPGRFGPPQPIG